ncbi:MAG: hypothetical protein QOF01_2751 [Thermomicrobiales bacterium]|nr:hypothetical protein [Thermomicrobiales bacterium]
MDLINLNMETPDWGLVVPQLIVFGLALVLLFAVAFLHKSLHYTWLTGI